MSHMYAACHLPLEGREFTVSLDDGLAVMSETVSLMCCWDQSAWAQNGYGTSQMPLFLSISYDVLQTLWLPDLPGDALLRENLILPKQNQVAQDLQAEPGSI